MSNLLSTSLQAWEWYNIPQATQHLPDQAILTMSPGEKTDFWQKTHYNGYCADNAPFFYSLIRGDFNIRCTLKLRPFHLYDQAGLCIRISDQEWVKLSLEYNPDGLSHMGSVVTTNGWSDWAYRDLVFNGQSLELSMECRGGDLVLRYCLGEGEWPTARICHMPGWLSDRDIQAGIYAACPGEGEGAVDFHFLSLEKV